MWDKVKQLISWMVAVVWLMFLLAVSLCAVMALMQIIKEATQ